MKSRVKGDFHARFRENAMVKVHGVTQLCPIKSTQDIVNKIIKQKPKSFRVGKKLRSIEYEKDSRFWMSISLFLTLFLFASCDPTKNNDSLPEVTTAAITSILQNTATSGGVRLLPIPQVARRPSTI
jgi:hypothetical protein